MTDIAPMNEWNRCLDEGLISKKESNGLSIFKYTFETTKKGAWNAVTIASRGLIVDNEGYIVARPFSKFFEYEEVKNKPSRMKGMTGPALMSDKLDGSLVMLFPDPETNEPRFATMNSLSGPHVSIAEKLYFDNFYAKWAPEEGYTYIFELISSELPNVVDYSGVDRLVLIGKIHNETGDDVPLNKIIEWPFEVADHRMVSGLDEALDLPDAINTEGFVLHFVETGARLKIKHPSYRALHRLTNWGKSTQNSAQLVKKVIAFGPRAVEIGRGIVAHRDKLSTEYGRPRDEVAYYDEIVDQYLTDFLELTADLKEAQWYLHDETDHAVIISYAQDHNLDPAMIFAVLRGGQDSQRVAAARILR